MKDKKDKQCRFIFTAAFGHKGANISGGHCIYIYIRGGTVHRCHGSVRTSVRGSRFDTISVQHEKKKSTMLGSFIFIYFEQTIVQIKKNPSRCENTTYYDMLYI